MNGCFSFRFKEAVNARKSLLLFFSGEVSGDVVAKVVKADVEQNLVPAYVYVLASESHRNSLRDLIADVALKEEVESFVGDVDSKLIYLYFSCDGNVFFDSNSSLVPSSLWGGMLQSGVVDIFQRRCGLIASQSNYHFLKPSGDHCNAFIRASNLLISSVEVSFIAIGLLPFISASLKRIYVDTSSVSYLVSQALSMSGKFGATPPLIESFESYAVFNKDYDFIVGAESLVFISATTSGGLAEKLISNSGFVVGAVINIFYSSLPSGVVGLFNITDALNGDENSYRANDCPLCKRGSRLIRIVGDQFLPETPTNEQLIIRRADFNKERSLFFSEFATKNILCWSQSSGPASGFKELYYIDIERVLSEPSPGFREIFERKVRKSFAVDVELVVSLDDSGSKAFSDAIRSQVGAAAEKVKWCSVSELLPGQLVNVGSVVVVAGAITSGGKLLDMSRRLRKMQPTASILYFVGFSKLSDSASLEQVRKDLQQGGHELVVLQQVPMPRVTENSKTSWDIEYDYLMEIGGDDPLGKSEALPKLLAERLSSFGVGQDNLFLPATNGKSLKLRPTFAFWSGLGLDTDKATQADVYWTMQALIHDLRCKVGKDGLNNFYHATVISPACFDRYNDGVIQSALIRSANPTELDYSISDDFSRKMLGVIISIVENHAEEQGEAALEFLLAMWVGSLRLTEGDTRRLCERFAGGSGSEDVDFLLHKISKS
ncbi:TPA: hypothetical protein ACKTGI_004008 [Pseudomonas aeruginosa]|uniref:hypothetical protein n=1 Tax=Pseudomonas aeruginosa TaxID=287 RepID=UPI0009A46F81|nr:hypothetical protein [Pseudomonas aeruginosa]MBG6343811.1 hypothetical protein [Pseudomonas aeruginosa]MBG7170624.1 hypothetical protein [Pseudomonas aeruginosa]MBH8780903.1 hypothetical protein [Pseudomonas aeruginosa]MBI7342827.1 hypothetical protein [Pseudomonas aeruginosa]MBI8783845.1 hypothetical protein [Pseudomonas aeruginosa]